MRKSKHTIEFEKSSYGKKITNKSIPNLAKELKIKKSILEDVYNRGRMAGINTGMRKGYNSIDGWGRVRMYKAINNIKKKRIPTGRGNDGDLVKKALDKK